MPYKTRTFFLTKYFTIALKRQKAVCDAGFISVLDFRNNPLKVFAAHELGVIDPSMGTKMTVQVKILRFLSIKFRQKVSFDYKIKPFL